MRRRFSS